MLYYLSGGNNWRGTLNFSLQVSAPLEAMRLTLSFLFGRLLGIWHTRSDWSAFIIVKMAFCLKTV